MRIGPVLGNGAAGSSDEGTTRIPRTAPHIRVTTFAAWRDRRIRRWARRELDAVLGEPRDPWALSTMVGDPYRDAHLDRSVQWRDHHGRRLLETGWTP